MSNHFKKKNLLFYFKNILNFFSDNSSKLESFVLGGLLLGLEFPSRKGAQIDEIPALPTKVIYKQ